MRLRIAVLLVTLLLCGAISTTGYYLASRITQLQQANTSLRQQVADQQSALSSEGTQTTQEQESITSLTTKVDGLTQPSDPLSAYISICNMPLVNDATGVEQTYYFPCTNVVQTIPEP
jgi:predicted PurR-regulated permease PerM